MSQKNKKVVQNIPKRWIACSVEEEYFGEERKTSKAERKLATSKDRSKYKKTDKEKFRKSEELHKNIKLSKENLLCGRVLSINPQGFIVSHEGTTFTCSLRGLLKKDKSQFKNLVTVGDFVLFEKCSDTEGLIAHVQPRKSVLSRADNLSRRKEQLIAANIDQVIITVSVVSPQLKPFLVDRYIIATQKGGMNPIIVVNKIDLLNDSGVDPVIQEMDKEIYQEFLKAYSAVNIPVISISTFTGQGLEDLRKVMQDKSSVFSGQSGVGKSSLINAITGLEIKTGNIVEKTQKGSHTTTTTNLVPLSFGGWCIDTPGIKSFGVWDLKLDEVEEYFSEIFEKGKQCKFPDCSHLHEQGCAVMDAVEIEEISPLRYESYLFLMVSIGQVHLRR
jgi:ribosome biogenesis GTPase / thiamine phosphate phosphatase